MSKHATLVALALSAALVVTASSHAMVLPSGAVNASRGERVPGVLVVNFAPGVQTKTVKAHPAGSVMGIPGVDELNVKYGLQDFRVLFPGADPAKAPRNAPDLTGWHVLQFADDVDLDAAAAAYQKDPSVARVEYDFYAYIMRTPNDALYTQQWDLSQSSDHDIDAPEAWNRTVGDPGIILADTDTGVLYSHEDLRNNIWVNPGEDLDRDGVVMDPDDVNGVDDDGNGYIDDFIGWDFVSGGSSVWPGEDGSTQDNDPKDFNGHGTHTSGTIAATTHNGVGVAGIAGGFGAAERGCKIMCLRMGYSFVDTTGSENGRTLMSYVAQAFRYAADNGAVAINYSFGSSGGGVIEAATDYAVAAGLVISAAAGNENSQSMGYLQSRSDVLCVASTTSSDVKSSFSNYGAAVDVSAPGSAIRSTVSNHYNPSYAIYSGTSMSAPHVVGLVGLIRSLNPLLTRQEVFDIITATADNIDALNPGYAGKLGSGRINAAAAVAELASTNFDGTPLVSAAPMTVQFADSSLTPATAWAWDFGDGDSATVQNPMHTFGPGLFDVSLRTQTGIGGGFKIKTNYVSALAETLGTTDTAVAAGTAVPIVIEFTAANYQPVTEILLPIAATNVTLSAVIDSFNTTGCRTSYFEYKQMVLDDRYHGNMCLHLIANNGGGAGPLPPGNGPIARLWMHTKSTASPAHPVLVDTTTFAVGPYSLEFHSPVLSYIPAFTGGFITINASRGDMNFDGVLNILDVVELTGVVFRSEEPPNPSYVADPNCDGEYSLQDLIRLIEHVFRNGAAPACP